MRHLHAAIIGSGFAGLGMAIKLKKDGIEDFLVFEREHDIGGVWRDNRYPGCACDVESHLYSFSFAPNPEWSHTFSPQAEILRYLQHCADRYDLRPHVKLGHELRSARFEQGRWHLETSQGSFTADVLISGTGALCDPAIPQIKGRENFEGKSFHSARWDTTHALEGKKVAVIGTGASAIQFVPAIQPKVEKLVLFQRTPPWIVPRNDRRISERTKTIFKKFPFAQFLARFVLCFVRDLFALPFFRPKWMGLAKWMATRNLEKGIADPELRKKLTPNYRIGCKRILLSDDYYPAVAKKNVDVVTAPIREIKARSVVTEDGVEHEVDTLIFGTGFLVTEQPIAKRVFGRDGRSLDEAWRGSPFAHLGTTIAGFPNLFMLLGPNTGLGHSSVVLMIESQIEHVIGALRFLRKEKAAWIEPTAEAQAAFVREVDEKMRGTVWLSGGCKSWYLDSTGRNSTLWPRFTRSFARRVEPFDPREYVATRISGPQPEGQARIECGFSSSQPTRAQ